MNVLCILQARMSSTRLPGKVLKPILGQPMLARQLERIRRARRIDRVMVATSIEPGDAAIESLCGALGVECFRGSLADVLDRYYQAALRYRPAHVMRLTGDCPLTDPEILDRLVEMHEREGNDYSANVHERTYPDGLDAEVFKFAMLEKAWANGHSALEREHVTPYMYRTGPDCKRGALKDSMDRSSLRWTVDYPEDFVFVSKIFGHLYPVKPTFNTADVHRLLAEQPELSSINSRGNT